MITNIDVNKIDPHPHNPRTDLGDLTELAESIKTHGILQNLTVVPWFSKITGECADNGAMDGHYVAVIGHRRLAAAKLAGLATVPCVISNIDMKTQVATMLLENMQRNELTLYEQAQGMQLMLDLGETAADISQKTGLSKNTIKNRIKLLDFEPDNFKRAVECGATIQDFIEINKIEDNDLKNKALEKVGTSNFGWELKRIIDEEERQKNRTTFLEKIKTFASPVVEDGNYKTIKWIPPYDYDEFEIPEDSNEIEYFYKTDSYYIALCVEQGEETTEKTTADTKATEKAKADFEKRKLKLEEISKRAFELRLNFIKNFKAHKKYIKDIIAMQILCSIKWQADTEIAMFEEVSGQTIEDGDDLALDTVIELCKSSPEKMLLASVYGALDGENQSYFTSWNLRYSVNDVLDMLYDFLEKLGYVISDEEFALMDSTHELYVKDAE